MLSEMGMYTLRYPYFQPSQQLDFGESGVDVMLCILRLFIAHRDRGVGGLGGTCAPPQYWGTNGPPHPNLKVALQSLVHKLVILGIVLLYFYILICLLVIEIIENKLY